MKVSTTDYVEVNFKVWLGKFMHSLFLDFDINKVSTEPGSISPWVYYDGTKIGMWSHYGKVLKFDHSIGLPATECSKSDVAKTLEQLIIDKMKSNDLLPES